MRPLPWFRGPNLGPFKFRDDAKRDITVLEHMGGGLHAEVFRVIVDGSIYALKMVCYIVPNGARGRHLGFGLFEVLLTWEGFSVSTTPR